MLGGMALAKRKQKISLAGPGYDARFEVGERVVADPLEPGQRMKATVNVRESAIAHMASRGRINTAQEAAGERFRKLWEQAAIGRSGAIDPGKEAVDGGSIGDPLTDELVRASRELSEAMNRVGMVGSRVLTLIVENGSIEKAAAIWSRQGGVVTGRRAEGYIAGCLVDALNELVRIWKLEGKGRGKAEASHYLRNGKPVPTLDQIRTSGPITMTGPSKQITVGRFGDIVVEEVVPKVDKGPLMIQTSANSQDRAQKGSKR